MSLEPKCPQCQNKMILRTARTGSNKGNKFYGCSKFPVCRGIVDFPYVPKAQKPSREFKPTDEQEALLAWVERRSNLWANQNPVSSLIVNAGPGTGKTSIIEAMMKSLKTTSKVYLSFDTLSRSEAQDRGLSAKTTHQLGMAAIRDYLVLSKYKQTEGLTLPKSGKAVVRENKTFSICLGLFGERNFGEYWKISPTIAAMEQLRLQQLDPSPKVINRLLDAMMVYIPKKRTNGELVQFIRQVYEKGIHDLSVVDFTDMLFMPVYYDLPVQQFRWVFVDETQDLNPLQMELVQRAIRQYSVFVGDKNQSVYLFRGAMANGMEQIKLKFNSEQLQLSHTFRLPKIGVELINELFPSIPFVSGNPNAEEGSIDYWSQLEFLQKVEEGDYVICRHNAPNFKMAFELLKRGKKPSIIGSELHREMTKLIKDLAKGNNSCTHLWNEIANYAEMQESKLRKRRQYSQVEILQDKIKALEHMITSSSSVKNLLTTLDVLFESTSKGVKFSTVHKAKGRENAKIILLDYENLEVNGKDKEETDEEYTQRLNIWYVALTRFQDTLILVQRIV